MTMTYKMMHAGWLGAALSEQKLRINVLLGRLSGFGKPEGMNLRVFRKFVQLMDQVAIAREKELHYMGRIEAMEQQHKWRRQHHMLKTNTATKRTYICEQPAPTACKKSDLLGYIAVWYLFSGNAVNYKNQGPTVD